MRAGHCRACWPGGRACWWRAAAGRNTSDQPAVDALVRSYDVRSRRLADHRVVEQRERADRADQLHDRLR